MIIWPAKDPEEALDFSWTVPVDAGDDVTGHTATRIAGTVATDSEGEASNRVTLWLSGGIADEVAKFSLTATTAGGRTFREVAVLPVLDRASDHLTDFRLRYPAFASIEDGQIGFWLTSAGAAVDAGWPDSDLLAARSAYAAHRMAELGILSSAIPAGVTSFKSGSFSATVSDSVASLTGLKATAYGREFLALRRRNFAGPRLAWTPPAATDV